MSKTCQYYNDADFNVDILVKIAERHLSIEKYRPVMNFNTVEKTRKLNFVAF